MALTTFILTALKGFAAFWALITFAVAAATQDKLNSTFGAGAVNNTNLAAGGAIIAAGVLGFLYFTAAVVLIFLRPESFLISLIIDTVVISFLFILSLGGTAAESTWADWFSDLHRYNYGSLGQATLGLAWVYTFLLLGILLFEVIYTLKHFGTSMSTWRTPFNQLASYGTPGITSTSAAPAAFTPSQAEAGTGGVPMSNLSAERATTKATPAAPGSTTSGPTGYSTRNAGPAPAVAAPVTPTETAAVPPATTA